MRSELRSLSEVIGFGDGDAAVAEVEASGGGGGRDGGCGRATKRSRVNVHGPLLAPSPDARSRGLGAGRIAASP